MGANCITSAGAQFELLTRRAVVNRALAWRNRFRSPTNNVKANAESATACIFLAHSRGYHPQNCKALMLNGGFLMSLVNRMHSTTDHFP